MTVQTAVDEALLPLRMAGMGLGHGRPAMVLREVDDALAGVHAQGYSRSSIRRYLHGNVFLCFGNATWHPSRTALVNYIDTNTEAARVHRGLAKQFHFAKLFLVKLSFPGAAASRKTIAGLSWPKPTPHHPQWHLRFLTSCTCSALQAMQHDGMLSQQEPLLPPWKSSLVHFVSGQGQSTCNNSAGNERTAICWTKEGF